MNIPCRFVTFAVLSLAVGACAVTPDYHPPAPDLPGAFGVPGQTGGAAVTAETSWWRTFGDPVLDSLIDRALRGNPDLRMAAQRVREARARVGIVSASRWPSVEAKASAVREKESENAPNPVLVRGNGEVESPGRQENIFQAGFDAKWEIDFFGAIQRRMEAQQAEIESVIYDRGAVTLTLIAEICKNYIELRGAQRQEGIARETLAAQRDAVGMLRSRLAAGMASELDVARAEAQLEKSASLLPPIELASARAIHRLSVLLGEPPATLGVELRAERPLSIPPSPPLGLPSDLLRNRPDIRGAERRVAAASARIGAAKTDLYPKFSLLGSAGLASASAGDFFNAGSTFWSIGPSLSWPILQRGRLVAVIEVRDAQQQEALIAYRQAILNAVEDAENAIVACRNDRSRREAFAREVDLEQRGANLTRDLYRSGLADYRAVVDADRSLLQAQSDLARAETALLLDVVALYKALGGGWQVSVAGGGAASGREGGAK